MVSRATPISPFANISPSSCRSSTSARCNLLPRPGALRCSRSSAAKIAPSNSGLIRSLQRSRSLHNQTSISLVAECSRILRSSIVFTSACCPVLDRRDDQLQLFFGTFKVLVKFYHLLERRNLLFRLPRLVERSN